MSTLTAQIAVRIDNGEPQPCTYETNTEMVDVSTLSAKPDPNWSAVDENGHFHAYDQSVAEAPRDPYPTLRIESLYHEPEPLDEEWTDADDEFEDDNEGWTETWRVCRICSVRVNPGTIPGPHYGTVPGLTTWEIEVDGETPERREVSVRLQAGDSEMFGVATSMGFDFATQRTRLLGIGPLGRRKAQP